MPAIIPIAELHCTLASTHFPSQSEYDVEVATIKVLLHEHLFEATTCSKIELLLLLLLLFLLFLLLLLLLCRRHHHHYYVLRFLFKHTCLFTLQSGNQS